MGRNVVCVMKVIRRKALYFGEIQGFFAMCDLWRPEKSSRCANLRDWIAAAHIIQACTSGSGIHFDCHAGYFVYCFGDSWNFGFKIFL